MDTLLSPVSKAPVLHHVGLLVARLGLGFILLAHGWQKYDEFTIAGTTDSFGDMGVPLPAVAAIYVTAVEIIGGLALIIGLFAPLFAALNMVSMLGAFFIVHIQNGLFVDNGGFELVLAIFAGLTLIAIHGAGRYSADQLLSRRQSAT